MITTAAENKKFIITYFNAISGREKTPELCNQFMTDIKLKENINFFDGVFPCYELFADEIIVEGNRAIVRARFNGVHKGEFMGIPPTFKKVDFPFAIGYTIENNIIIDHWIIADQLTLLKQLGINSIEGL